MTLPSVNPSPYPWIDNGNDTYDFSTEDGINYHFYFTEGASYFPEGLPFASQVKMFGFKPTNYEPKIQVKGKFAKIKLKNIYDSRVEITLVKAIKEFFTNPQAILTYVCLQSDGRQAERHRRFNIMYQRHFADQFIKRNFAEGPEIYASIIFRNDNPYLTDIEDSIAEFEDKY